jgi:hypothetical protein
MGCSISGDVAEIIDASAADLLVDFITLNAWYNVC